MPRRYVSKTKVQPHFGGFKRGYDKWTGDRIKPYTRVFPNERAIAMIGEEVRGGRPAMGSAMKAHRIATDKMRELDFDPIDKLVSQLERVEGLLVEELGRSEPRQSYITNLIQTQTRISEVLLVYRYGKAPMVTIETTDMQEPLRIILEGI